LIPKILPSPIFIYFLGLSGISMKFFSKIAKKKQYLLSCYFTPEKV